MVGHDLYEAIELTGLGFHMKIYRYLDGFNYSSIPERNFYLNNIHVYWFLVFLLYKNTWHS